MVDWYRYPLPAAASRRRGYSAEASAGLGRTRASEKTRMCCIKVTDEQGERSQNHSSTSELCTEPGLISRVINVI